MLEIDEINIQYEKDNLKTQAMKQCIYLSFITGKTKTGPFFYFTITFQPLWNKIENQQLKLKLC